MFKSMPCVRLYVFVLHSRRAMPHTLRDRLHTRNDSTQDAKLFRLPGLTGSSLAEGGPIQRIALQGLFLAIVAVGMFI